MPRQKASIAISNPPKSHASFSPTGTRESHNALVGVLTSGKNINQGIPTGKKARIFREMVLHANEKNVDLFFFHPEDVNWKQKRIKGLVLSGQKSWIMKSFPFPDIVYNRILYRNIERTDHVRILLKRFEAESKVELFNTRFLEKWEVYQAFCRSGDAVRFLPETDLFSRSNLQRYCQNYSEVFLKPRNGSKGKGIIKIRQDEKGQGFFYSRAETAKQDRWRHVLSFEALYRDMIAMGVAGNRYLVQRGIDLVRYQGRVFDIRGQVQKDGDGEWVFTGAGARVAARNSFVTHIPNGGHLADLKEVISEVFDPSAETINKFMAALKSTGIMAGQILDNELGLNLAILSLDIGIDSHGRMWILEINSKPASFDEDNIRYRHFEYLMDYARYIGRKKNMRNDD